MKIRRKTAWLFWCGHLALSALACGGDSSGRAQFFVAVEDSIPDGIDPGPGEEQIQDGWQVRYDKFLVVLGNVTASRQSAPAEVKRDHRLFVMDLLRLPPGGLIVADFSNLAAEQWDRVSFDMVPPAASGNVTVTMAAGIDQTDYDRMVQGGFSLYIEGKLTKSTGMSCRPNMPTDCVPATAITFRWGLPAATRFADCAPGGGGLQAGFAVPSGGTVQVRPTIHGDHWFFTNITQGAEITMRRAQWVADSDRDRNGETTLEELRVTTAASVFPASEYNLSGALLPVQSAYDYLEAQVRTIVDYQGDGECPTRTIL